MMKIYDLDISYGTQVKPQASPYCSTIEELVDVMQNAGLDGALIRCTDTDIVSTQTGNARLARDLRIAKAKGLDVWGLWALLPSCTDDVRYFCRLLLPRSGQHYLRMQGTEEKVGVAPTSAQVQILRLGSY